MTNPGNAVGTNGGYGGRTSVNAFNDVLSAFNGRGVIKGWACVPKTGMTVSLGGQDLVRDVAIVENDIGQFTTLDNISTQPIDITLSDAPTLGSRIDVIVGYVTNPPDSNGELIDNPDACGIIAVESSVTTNPTAPDEAMIREAITDDGGSGVNAYYVVLAQVQVGTGMTTITNTEVTQGSSAYIPIPSGSITGEEIAGQTVTSQNVDWETFSDYSATGKTSSNIGTTWTTVASYTAPHNGVYAVDFKTGTGNQGTKSHILDNRVQINGISTRTFTVTSSANYAGNHIVSLSGALTRKLSAGDTITLQGRVENVSTPLSYEFAVQQC